MVMEQFDSMPSPVIDSTPGLRCSSIIGYQYSEIVRSLMSVYFCGGSCVEEYEVDFDHQFLETEKNDAKLTYKKLLSYMFATEVLNCAENTLFRFIQHRADGAAVAAADADHERGMRGCG